MTLRILAAAAAVLVASAVPADATADSVFDGDCGYLTVVDRLNFPGRGPGTYRGELHLHGLLYSPTRAVPPVSASVTCEIRVNGVAQAGARMTLSGTGAVAGANVVTFTTTSRHDDVRACLEVDFADATPTRSFCYPTLSNEFPPEPPTVVEDHVDPVLCDVAGGDVGMREVAYYDCPPYAG